MPRPVHPKEVVSSVLKSPVETLRPWKSRCTKGTTAAVTAAQKPRRAGRDTRDRSVKSAPFRNRGDSAIAVGQSATTVFSDISITPALRTISRRVRCATGIMPSQRKSATVMSKALRSLSPTGLQSFCNLRRER